MFSHILFAIASGMVHSRPYQICIDRALSSIAKSIIIQLFFHFSQTHRWVHISAASKFTSSQSIVGTMRTAISVLVVCFMFDIKSVI